jgi:exopolysaccharide biosynthesis protein
MTRMTQKEALDFVQKNFRGKLTTDEIFELYDIISAVNLSGWDEGKKTALMTFAIDTAKILYPEDYAS